ncbi:MAG: phosphatidylglycerol lysyltransferase domain-containing protein [Deltaproteobacteria bacterium]|nr:phosphatidylglycerol lysyltransferase domain-containing protein [Deltaproteobacteria bacterium]
MSRAFKPLEMADRDVFTRCFREDQPNGSEMTFTNLFMWRHRYRPFWCEREGCLLVVCRPEGLPPFALQPAGRGDKRAALQILCEELSERTSDIRIRRVEERFVTEHVDPTRFEAVYDPDNSDYVYRTADLIRLSGRKYHRKRNHLNRFCRQFELRYRPLDLELVECFLDMQDSWCRMRECAENPDLLSEDHAVREALTQFEQLGLLGGAIQIEGKLEAFSLGEPLNQNTAVVHVEKANPDIPGLYAAINQQFCENALSGTAYVNREQDLGDPGLRKAKESYYPHHMVKKYSLVPL